MTRQAYNIFDLVDPIRDEVKEVWGCIDRTNKYDGSLLVEDINNPGKRRILEDTKLNSCLEHARDTGKLERVRDYSGYLAISMSVWEERGPLSWFHNCRMTYHIYDSSALKMLIEGQSVEDLSYIKRDFEIFSTCCENDCDKIKETRSKVKEALDNLVLPDKTPPRKERSYSEREKYLSLLNYGEFLIRNPVRLDLPQRVVLQNWPPAWVDDPQRER